jgi:hypothetical protein
MGVYPETGLKEARAKRDEARKLLADGVDPGETRKAMKAAKVADAETIEVIAREWFSKNEPTWARNHANRIIRRLERDLFPWIGNVPELLEALRRIESRGAVEEACKRIKHRLNLEHLSGIAWLAAQQDFGAKMLCDNLNAVAVFCATEQNLDVQVQSGYRINRT